MEVLTQLSILYECDRCGDLVNHKGDYADVHVTDLTFYDFEANSIHLCRECKEPLVVFLRGFMGKTGKNKVVDEIEILAYNK